MQLLLDFYIARPLFEREQLEALHKLITTHLPVWSRRLTLAEEESLQTRAMAPHEGLSLAAHEAAPVKFGLGSMVIKGSFEDLLVFVDSCRSTLPPELNELTVEIVDLGVVEGTPVATWARTFFLAALDVLPVRYAKAYGEAEFDAKNMMRDDQTETAVGMQLDRSLPGLYWLNYFGDPYVRLIGREHLLASPAHETRPVSDGVFIARGNSPDEWHTAHCRQCERRVIAHLGEQFFFAKERADRKTVAPSFR